VARTDTSTTVFDLENPFALAWLDDPMLALQNLRGLVLLDENQRRPVLFPVLRTLADRPQSPVWCLVLGGFALSEISKSYDIFGAFFRP
jgi:uncharacterized protein